MQLIVFCEPPPNTKVTEFVIKMFPELCGPLVLIVIIVVYADAALDPRLLGQGEVFSAGCSMKMLVKFLLVICLDGMELLLMSRRSPHVCPTVVWI